MLQRARRGLQQATGVRECACAPRESATARSLGRRRSTRVCSARAPCRAGWSRPILHGSSLRQRDGLSPSGQDRASMCQPRPSTSSRRSHVRKRERATVRSLWKGGAARALSLGRRRRTHACGARAPRRAGLSRSMLHGSPLRQRDGPLSRCATVFRRASRGLEQAVGVRVCAQAIRHRTLSAGRRRRTRACGARVARRAGWSGSMPHGTPLRQRHGSFPRCTTVLRRTGRGLQRAAGVRLCACAHTRTRHRALSLGRRRSTRVCSARAAPRWLESVHALWKPTAPARRSFSLGARPCSNVPAAASNEQPAFACAHTQTRHRALSLGRRRSIRACGARAPRRACWSGSMPYAHRSPLRQREGLSPSVHERVPTCPPRPATSSRHWRVRARERATARSLWGEAPPACLRPACAMPRWLESVHTFRNPTAPARRTFSSVHNLTPTCQSRPLTSSRRLRVRTRECAAARYLSGGSAVSAIAARAPAPCLLEPVHALRKPTAPTRRPLFVGTQPCLTCHPRSPTCSRRSRVRTRERATARSLSGGGAARTLVTRARGAALV